MSAQSPEAIRSQLRKVLASAAFEKAERMRRFLGFIVDRTLSSPEEPLKEMVIGIELYAPHQEFDPRLSAVVRVDAARLRSKLRDYYATEGATDRLIIDLPKGSYTPVFFESPIQPSNAPSERGISTESAIAVLPFSNLSPEPEEYFSDGLTDEIIHALSAIEGIRVVARSSTFAFRHKNCDVREIGRTLNVGFVLEGSVRQSGEELRVTVQLVSTTDGYQLWSRRYDQHIHDVFAVQDEIAREVVNMLRVSTANRARAASARSADNFEAYTWYLRGRYHSNRQTSEALHRAIDCFDQALARNPRYAAALSGQATAWFYLGVFAMTAPLDAMPKAREAAAHALEVSDHEGEAMAVAACTRAMLEWDWSGAESLFLRSLLVKPVNDFSMHMFAMFTLLPMARIEEALTMLDEARKIDPLSLYVAASRTAVLLMARRTAEAEAECRRALELDADFWRALVALGRCHEAYERYDDAIACFERAKEISGEVPSTIGALGRAYALAGRTREAHNLLHELDDLAQRRYVSPYGRALIFLGLRDDKVFDWLERSYHERSGWLIYLATDPRFDPLREDVRFRSFLNRLGLPLVAYPARG
jgi:TolB-like protein